MRLRRPVVLILCLLVGRAASAQEDVSSLQNEAVTWLQAYLGITAYGFTPVVIPFEDEGSVHGNNERISLENVRRGVTMMLEITRRVTAN